MCHYEWVAISLNFPAPFFEPQSSHITQISGNLQLCWAETKLITYYTSEIPILLSYLARLCDIVLAVDELTSLSFSSFYKTSFTNLSQDYQGLMRLMSIAQYIISSQNLPQLQSMGFFKFLEILLQQPRFTSKVTAIGYLWLICKIGFTNSEIIQLLGICIELNVAWATQERGLSVLPLAANLIVIVTLH